MAPREDSLYAPIPPRRARFGISGEEYLEIRYREDGAQNLWRVYDRIYDLSDFAKSHPGGSYWITLTKGLDITEMFESHHITETAERVLAKYPWKAATTPRRSPYTFHEDGFFKRAKRKAAEAVAKVPNRGGITWQTTLVVDTLATFAALAAMYAAVTGSFLSAWLSGMAIGLLFTSSHNFTHLKNNWRQYYIVVAMISLKDWRTSHILSHHHFPNTELDMECLQHEPIIDYYPRTDKGWKNYLQCAVFPVYVGLIWPIGGLSRLIELRGSLIDLLNLSPLFVMVATSVIAEQDTNGFLFDFLLFAVISFSESFTANMIGFTVAHHHPDIYHHGDEPREDKDWGIAQLDAVRDRADSKTDFLLSTLTFGDHSAHHLFPSLDHGRLELVHDAINSTLDEMGLKRLKESWPNLFLGMFKQILRKEGRPVTCRNLNKEK